MSGAAVEMTRGKISGSVESSARVFRGVPYAASAAGAGRFRLPTPPKLWTGVREATAFGNRAPQPSDGVSTLSPEFGAFGLRG
jgi:para-nitrobenzyl esterase